MTSNFVCPKCFKTFPGKEVCVEHIKTHYDMTTKYVCSKCFKAYLRRDHCVEHTRTHDADYVRKNLTCECGRTYFSPTSKKRHQRDACRLYKKRRSEAKQTNSETETAPSPCIENQEINENIIEEDNSDFAFEDIIEEIDTDFEDYIEESQESLESSQEGNKVEYNSQISEDLNKHEYKNYIHSQKEFKEVER